MKCQLILAGAALAPLVSAANVHRRHGWHHSSVDAIYITDWNVATVVDYTTVYPGAPSAAPAPAHSSSAIEVGTSSPSAASSNPVEVDTSGSATAASSTPVAVEPTYSVDASSVPADIASAATSSVQAVAQAATTFAKYSKATSAVPAPSATPSSVSTGGSISSSKLSPNGIKAGLSGYVGIQQMPAFTSMAPYISWYSDYTPNTPDADNVTGVGMLWGATGSACSSTVTSRVSTFNTMVTSVTPKIMFGFYEPDCKCGDSSEMSTSSGTAAWNSMLAPLGKKGTILGSPSMCKQKDEDWLTPFSKSSSGSSLLDHDWDVTSIHINKPNITGVMEDVDYYVRKYGKPIWVSEFACVDDSPSWAPCTDQTQINTFIQDAVKFFQGNESVVAYGPSNGDGLGTVWPLTTAAGALTESGTTYLNAIKGL